MICDICKDKSPKCCEECATRLLKTEKLREMIEQGLKAGFRRPHSVNMMKMNKTPKDRSALRMT